MHWTVLYKYIHWILYEMSAHTHSMQLCFIYLVCSHSGLEMWVSALLSMGMGAKKNTTSWALQHTILFSHFNALWDGIHRTFPLSFMPPSRSLSLSWFVIIIPHTDWLTGWLLVRFFSSSFRTIAIIIVIRYYWFVGNKCKWKWSNCLICIAKLMTYEPFESNIYWNRTACRNKIFMSISKDTHITNRGRAYEKTWKFSGCSRKRGILYECV